MVCSSLVGMMWVCSCLVGKPLKTLSGSRGGQSNGNIVWADMLGIIETCVSFS